MLLNAQSGLTILIAEQGKGDFVTVLSAKFRETLKEVFPDIPCDDLAQLKAGEGAWDSLGHLRLMMALETAYGISIPPEAFEKLQSAEQIEAYIRAQ